MRIRFLKSIFLAASGSWSFLIAFALPASATSGGSAAGLVGWWSFEDCDGLTVRDRSPLGNDGVIDAGVVWQEKGGHSLALDGLGAEVTIRPKAPFGFSKALTATAWVRPAALLNRTVLFGVPHSNPEWTTPMFGMYLEEGRVVFGLWGAKGAAKALVKSPDPLPLDTWTFLAGTFDGESVRLFVNDKMVAELPHRGGIADNGLPLIIGKGLGSDKPSFKGRVGELRLHARTLSSDEIQELYRVTGSAFDLTPPPARPYRDGVVTVDVHGRSPEDSEPWLGRPTRLLELLDGYQAGGQSIPVNTYGGRLDRPQEEATGFFRVMKIGPRNWLIDPEGRRYYNIGLNTVREPQNSGTHFGTTEQWATTVTGQLRKAGFTGLGNASSSVLRKVSQPLVRVLSTNFMFEFAKQKKLTVPASGTIGFIGGCMPVFHPDFEPFCEKKARDLAATADDPFLLGIMTDNELQCRPDLLDRFLALDAAHADLKHGRTAAQAWLAERRSGGEKEITQRERYEFIAFVFDRYYTLVRAAIRRHDPNHLYLGSRINYANGQLDNPFFWKVLARHHDVVSVNYYNDWGPQARQCAEWSEWSGGLPILFTEWYAKAMDVPGLANIHGAGWLVRTQEDRGRYYQHFALNALEIPSVVGWHWFKYLDDPSESQALDAVGGSNKGMFDAEGKPHQPLLDRARAVNREAIRLIDFFDRRKQL